MRKIIVYKQQNKSKSVQLSRELNGYTDRSNYGKYSYKREGLLDRIPHRKLYNGVFILRSEDLEEFIRLLEKYETIYYVGDVVSTSEKADLP